MARTQHRSKCSMCKIVSQTVICIYVLNFIGVVVVVVVVVVVCVSFEYDFVK